MIDLSTCNSHETKLKIATIVSKVPLQTVISHFREKFYMVDNTIELLYTISTSKSNGILYGPGGFGKTEVTKEFFEYFNIPVSVKVGYEDMDVEGLLGVPNMKKLLEESEYVTAFEKSVFNNPGVLILEEFLDVRSSTAIALKDILTEGGLRQGNKFTPSKIGPIIICSNKDPEVKSVDDSSSAFYKERFPCSLFVAWESYSRNNYENLFRTVFANYEELEDTLSVVAGLCSKSSVNKIVSPRIAMEAAKVAVTSGIIALKFFSDIDTTNIDEVSFELKQLSNVKVLKSLINKVSSKVDEIINDSFYDLEESSGTRSVLVSILGELNSIPSSDDMLEVLLPFKDRLQTAISICDNHIMNSSKTANYKQIFFYDKFKEISHKLSK